MNTVKSLHREFVSNITKHSQSTANKRNLILSILKSTTTKREAKNYLTKYRSHFDEPDNRSVVGKIRQQETYVDRFLTGSDNVFRGIYTEQGDRVSTVPLRVALFKMKCGGLDAGHLQGIAATLRRLMDLGISPVILMDYENWPAHDFKTNESYMFQKGHAISALLGRTTIVSDCFSRKGDVETSVERILIPLCQNIIPIVQPMISGRNAQQEFGDSNELLQSLAKGLLEHKKVLSIEKVVMIDPIGGIPSIERDQTSHVFVNLAQEYADIVSELFIGHISPFTRDTHVTNLAAMDSVLRLIARGAGNDDATGIITTPEIMALSDDQVNPVLYNVLTDRPIISSSLPSRKKRTPRVSTTILKKGIDVQVFNSSDAPSLTQLFHKGLVDKDRLVAVINDSFGRELDSEAYFKRIDNRLATLVVLGDYDGAAIITFEGPKKVPYLDKFAIAKKNQGLPGLADIIFKIILQSYPNELFWRSRKNNPVNKWYFERCSGCMSAPGSPWMMFYTGEIFDKKIRRRLSGVLDVGEKLGEYGGMIENIRPSFK